MVDHAQTGVEAAPAADFLVPLQPLGFTDPWRWLALGTRDFLQAPLIGLCFGACFVGMGWALLAVFEHAPAYVLWLSAGFLLVGPFLCMGLYRVSDQLARGARPSLLDAALIWRRQLGTLGIFGLMLLVLEMMWARASLVVFALATQGTMPDFAGSLRGLLNPKNLDFIIAWMTVGGVFATIIFAISVISIPMILDRGTDAISAGLTSVRLVLKQPALLLAWAATIAVLVAIAMLPGFAGLLVVAPILGHASWHAYRAAVAPHDHALEPAAQAC